MGCGNFRDDDQQRQHQEHERRRVEAERIEQQRIAQLLAERQRVFWENAARIQQEIRDEQRRADLAANRNPMQ